jgi:hypothetical protein
MLTLEKADRWEMDGSPYISGNVQKVRVYVDICCMHAS